MHFPQLVRRLAYKKTRSGTYYADYRMYYDEVSEDCKKRCVYCDVQLEEIGGEGMHIDHFKPQKHFPELANLPENLVLACARCNHLKSDWWPEKTGNANNGLHGFIDPFDKDKAGYFEVSPKGKIIGMRPPAAYVIELLTLNRVSRISIRHRRILVQRAQELIDEICREMDVLPQQPLERMQQRLPILAVALQQVKELL